jgi:flagellar hook-associated protein 1 FlgK
MGGILTTLLNSTNALSAYDRVFNAVQNNITNANTPGYVDQNQSLTALPFNPQQGISGGVIPGPVLSSRNEYLEQDVRNQQQFAGDAQQRASDLGQVQPLFDLTKGDGIDGTLNGFFNSFSQLSVNPNDEVARQSVITAAGQVAQSFNQTAIGINQVSNNVDNQTRATVAQINALTAQIAHLNSEYQANSAAGSDAGLDAAMHSDLENLAGLVNFSIIKSNDGTFNVYLGGQTPLVIGGSQLKLSTDFSSPQTVIRDSQSNDVTAEIGSGSLGAMLREKNATLPGYMSLLNKLSQTFADQVNGQLSQGVDKTGAAPTTNLFSYDQPGDAAYSLAVTGITPDEIAAATAAAPGGNGNAIALANLATSPLVNGFTFTQAYGNLGAAVGTDVTVAQQDQSQYQDSLTQSRQLRQQQTGVSIDAEAAKLLQFQQAYQAVGKMVAVLDDVTQTLLNMVR